METLTKTLKLHLPFSKDILQIYLIPSLFALSFFIGATIFILRFQKKKPFYPFSLADFCLKTAKDSLFTIEDRLSFLRLLTLFVLSLALTVPTLITPESESSALQHKEIPPKEGSAIFLLLDQSGSIGKTIYTEDLGKTRLIDYLKYLSKGFVKSIDANNRNPQRKDMIGLLAFARYPYVIVPPTFEHDVLMKAIDHLDVVKSNNEDGSSLSYAIYKTANLIGFLQNRAKDDTHFNLDSSAIILITDGVETISPEDVNNPLISISMENAAATAAKLNIPIYLLIIFPELRNEAYAPQRKEMQRVASMTKGGFYILDEAKDVKPVLEKIQQLESKPYTPPDELTYATKLYTPLWPNLLLSGFLLFLLYLFLELYVYRSVP